MIPQPPPGQGPIDPRGAFSPPPPPGGAAMPPGGPGMPPPGMSPPGMMPPFMMPPMFMPPPRQGGFFRGLINTLLVTVFLASLSLNVYLLLFAGILGLGKDATNATVLLEGDLNEQVAVLPIRGEISSRTYEKFDKLLRKIEKDNDVKAIVIDIDTPGGEVTASDQIYNRIQQVKGSRKIPVIVKQGSLATSGGYYISCAGDYIFAEPTTLTANIGVLLPNYNWSELAQKYGVKEVTSVASGSTYKNSGSPFQQWTERDAKYWQGLTDGMYARFKKVVVDGRGSALKVPIDQAADGRAVLADEAKQAGLVDDIGYLDTACTYAAQQAHLKKPHVVRYDEMPSLFDMFGSESKLPGASLQAGNVTVKVDASLLHELSTPRAFYLWRGQ